jgi:hypothetical protein
MERMGEGLRPLIQVAQIIVSRFITPLTAGFDDLNKMVTAHWKEWVGYVDRYLVPAFKNLVDRGWKLLFGAVKWWTKISRDCVSFAARNN